MSGKLRLMGTRADGGHNGMTGRGARRDAIAKKKRRFNQLKNQMR